VGGGVGEVFGLLAEAGADGVVVNIVAAGVEVVAVADAVVAEASLPGGEMGGEAVGEAALDELHGALEGEVLWGEKEVDVVGHDDEGVEEVVAFVAVVLEGLEEEFGVGVDLEEASSVVGGTGDEICTVVWSSVGDGHGLA
jgi:hypothetical protein